MTLVRPSRRLASCGLTLCLVAVLTCGVAAAAQPAQPPPSTLPAQGPSSQYIIGPGDTLQVFVWRNPDLSQTVPVRPDGRISTPLVQNMVAVGKTPAQLAHDMEQVLGQYIRSPQVNIIVTQPVAALSQVKIIGQVAHPESIPYRAGMTVLDVVLQAGGLTIYAAGNRAKLVRTDHGQTTETPVRLDKLVQKGDLSQNLPVKPGDVLVVPQALF